MSDPIANLLSNLSNSIAVGKKVVEIPFSGLKYEILKIMEKEGIISEVKPSKDKKTLSIKLGQKYLNFKRLSKPGRRLYYKYRRLPRFKREIMIISTPKGLMTTSQAVKNHLGGEAMLEVW